MTNSPPFRTAVIIGGGGGVGSLISRELADAGVEQIIALDPCFNDAMAAENNGPIRLFNSDIRDVDRESVEFLATADLVVLAVPSRLAISSVPKLLPILSEDVVLVDTLSVKSEYLSTVKRHNISSEILSINPMFAPDLGFPGQSVLSIDVTEGPNAPKFEALLRDWGSRVTRLSIDQHERYTASLQAATHAALFGFGMTLAKMSYSAPNLRPLCPPPHHVMLAMLARIVGGNPETYLEIQRDNPYAKAARGHLLGSLAELAQATEDKSDKKFADIISAISDMLGPEQDSLANSCQDLFERIGHFDDRVKLGPE